MLENDENIAALPLEDYFGFEGSYLICTPKGIQINIKNLNSTNNNNWNLLFAGQTEKIKLNEIKLKIVADIKFELSS
jgi:hypothetical protein